MNQIVIPQFDSSKNIREHVVFSGRVQNIGFRMEVFLLATKLGLTGWVMNRDDGSVEAEFQGAQLKIEFLIQYMKSLIRAKVKTLTIEPADLIQDEKVFCMNEDNNTIL